MNDIEKNTIHPSHYNKEGRKECWLEMEERFGTDSVITFDILSAYKYLYRAGAKEGNPREQDIAKIRNYIDHAEMLTGKLMSNSDNKAFEPLIAVARRKLDKIHYCLEKEGIDNERTNNTDD